jgi:uncharacterized membrane-anchored protein YitT (DUF2179 family)
MTGFKFPQKSLFSELKDYVGITIALVIYSLGWAFFLLPYELVSGGVAGIGAIVEYATGFPIQYSFLIINAVLLIVAIKELGVKFCIKTIYAVFVVTFCLGFIKELLAKYEFNALSVLGPNATFEACIIGAAFCGLGIGLCFVNNGSSGGTDIIAAVVNKYRDVSLGRIIVYIDIAIVMSSFFVIKDCSLSKVFYGLITLLISSTMIDFVINSNRRTTQFMIFSKKYEEISDYITTELHRGVTLLNSMGYYSKEDSKVIVTMVRGSREASEILRIVKEIDPNAFVSQARVSGVFGYGFDKIKVK